MIPYVKISFTNGALNSSTPSNDGVCLMLAPKATEDKQYYNLIEYTNAGGSDPNIVAFFNNCSNARLIIAALGAEVESPSETIVEGILQKYNGIVNIIIYPAKTQAELQTINKCCEYATNTLYAPCMALCSCEAAIDNIHSLSYSRIAVVDNLVDESNVPLLYHIAGRLADIPVQRSLARVKDGALPTMGFYNANGLVNNSDAETANTKGYISVRNYVGKTGFYPTDDPMAVATADDYALIPRRRVIDKAYRIAYTALVDYIGEEVPVTSTGTVSPHFCKDVQNYVERALENNLTVYGNVASDDTNSGVECYISTDQNIVSTSRLEVVIKVRPYGYAKYIEVKLGFQIEN